MTQSSGLAQVRINYPTIRSSTPIQPDASRSGTFVLSGSDLISPFGNPPTLRPTSSTFFTGLSLKTFDPAAQTVTYQYTVAAGSTITQIGIYLNNGFGEGFYNVPVLPGKPSISTVTVDNSSGNQLKAGKQVQTVRLSGLNFGSQVPTIGVASATADVSLVPGTVSQVSQMTSSGTTQDTVTFQVKVSSNAPSETTTFSLQPSGTSSIAVSPLVSITPVQPVDPLILDGLSTDYASCSGENIGLGPASAQRVVVGQVIRFSACVPDVDFAGFAVPSLATGEWGGVPSGISTQAVSGYSLTNYKVNDYFGVKAPETSVVVPLNLSSPCTTNSSFCDFAPFYFVTPGTYDFTFSYKLNNGTSTKTSTVEYIVIAPLASAQGTYLEEIEIGKPQILAPGQDFSGANDSILSSGDSVGTERGIRFRVTASPPSNQFGNFQWVQKIIARSRIFRTHESIGCSFCVESQALDNVYPYPSDLGREEDTQDTPNTFLSFTKLDGNGQQVDLQPYDISDSFKAEMYLMWDPALNMDGTPAPGCAAQTVFTLGGGVSTKTSTCTGSIPVPLGSIVWGYCGEAIQTLKNQPTISPTPARGATSWILACPTGGTGNQVISYKDGLSAQTFPNWTTLSQNH